ncbi:DUF409 domain protein [Talaromyces proteolyticus]|uniref:GPI mannosyltransferase 2 n=1 Tax=Talaromyces proteolyticus TaxID=1131652 RepID=A0AAD4Q0U1_9EURO|nr:DUF409 domain protein [Talaromyces proteolyticus]KAH8697636.1 DUF409 domain protein [Talaromyces proteolyticus]
MDLAQKPDNSPAQRAEGKPIATGSTYLQHPIWSLAGLFLAWKLFLFVVVVNCPGLGYDASTNLLTVSETDEPVASLARILKFVRWDSIYFVRIAERNYLFEQEWAFPYGRVLRSLTSALGRSGRTIHPPEIAVIGILLSHISHFLSVLALFSLSNTVLGHETSRQRALCFVSAALHVISPAGAFLSAPYGEPVFSCLNLSGFYVYALAIFAEQTRNYSRRDLYFIVAGVLFAGATLIRGNGILSGSLFAYDAVQGAISALTGGLSFGLIRRTVYVVIGGSIIALAMVVPQYIAFQEYCQTNPDTVRPWCGRLLPSIYTWVQAHYWNNGFLRYWTISNLPLFLLAAPILSIMFYSSMVALWGRLGQSSSVCWSHVPQETILRRSIVVRLAIPQGILAVMAFTSFHVQIINRISSGYAVWYWYLASVAFESPSRRAFGVIVQAMVMYAGIQAVLYGSFLPPA